MIKLLGYDKKEERQEKIEDIEKKKEEEGNFLHKYYTVRYTQKCPKCGNTNLTKFLDDEKQMFTIKCHTLSKNMTKEIDNFFKGHEKHSNGTPSLWTTIETFPEFKKQIESGFCSWSISF